MTIRMKGSMLLMALLPMGCLDETEDPVHLSMELWNCGDSAFRSICISKGIAEDGPFHAFLDTSFRVTLTGNLLLDGKDTVVSEWKVPADFGSGTESRFDLPEGIGKTTPPLELVGCIRDAGGARTCDTLRHPDL